MTYVNAVLESLELLLAICDYHGAVDSLARLGPVEPDSFGYGTEDANNRLVRVARTKARMEALSARDRLRLRSGPIDRPIDRPKW